MSDRTFTAVYGHEGEWWIGWIKEMPGAIAHERTLEETRQSLREVIPVLLDLQRAQQAAADIREELSVSVGSGAIWKRIFVSMERIRNSLR